jgi:hypothetical protein
MLTMTDMCIQPWDPREGKQRDLGLFAQEKNQSDCIYVNLLLESKTEDFIFLVVCPMTMSIHVIQVLGRLCQAYVRLSRYRLSSLWAKLPWERLFSAFYLLSPPSTNQAWCLDPIARKAGNLSLEAARITAVLYIPVRHLEKCRRGV